MWSTAWRRRGNLHIPTFPVFPGNNRGNTQPWGDSVEVLPPVHFGPSAALDMPRKYLQRLLVEAQTHVLGRKIQDAVGVVAEMSEIGLSYFFVKEST